ncbi:hypothetical protein SAMN06269173_111100 [Hymenobacter mucosus]|uniref:Uncharacterized protein n=1 Tax=Hymenobacter mucosus TaxID=1411120 RepID=A0A239AC52_9BACT|nr:hypothetical protein SAMN06269173_111100 [Hymenobacter mucosus]
MGEFRLPSREARYLTWLELDSIYYGYERAYQRSLLGARQVAWETHNLTQMMSGAKKPQFSPSPRAYWPLSLIDGPEPEALPKELPNERMRAYLEKKYGTPIVFETD